MKHNKVLAELEFDSVLNSTNAQTQSGQELLNNYKSYLMANESSCKLVNNFIKEAQNVRYDSGVNNILESVADYIMCNKTSWALASACEAINNNNQSYNYLNKNAAKQVEKLLEMEEDDVVKYIKAGALKNVMFCEAFRNIAKQVYKDQPIIESTAEYTVMHPVSITENVGDGVCFEICGTLYKIDNDKNIQEAAWNEVSQDFKNIAGLLESNMVTVDGDTIYVKFGKHEYQISESDKCVKITGDTKLELTTEQLRDNNKLMLNATNPRFRNQMCGVLESIALLCENYDKVASMDNVSIYATKKDKFVVIESNNYLYASLLQSSHSPKWTINENVIDALTFIKKKTNVALSENYKEQVSNCLEQVTEKEQEKIQNELHEQNVLSYKERIEALTEKFKNDPVKLAVLSKLAQDIQNI